MKQLVVLALCCAALVFADNSVEDFEGRKTRLTNNDYAKLGEFPYLVSLQIDGFHVCGGSLITKRHVLTAAHCVYDWIQNRTPKNRLKVVVGTVSLGSGTRMGVQTITRHPQYLHIDVSPTMVNDVAVITLTNPVTLSNNVKTIALPPKNYGITEGTSVVVAGFGTNVLNGPSSRSMKKLYMYTTSKASCQSYWGNRLKAGHICASHGKDGICQGDSGGALATGDKKYVVGIVSATSGRGCATNVPDLFTRVSEYIDFIKAVTG